MADSLRDMTEAVRQRKPNCTAELARQFVNKRIRVALNKYRFSGLIRLGSIAIPDSYETGTVSATQGSKTVTGSGTAWPYNDLVSTTVSQAVSDLGYQDVIPVSMANISVGMFISLDADVPASREVLPVVAASLDRFTVYCSKAHSAGAKIYASSLANRQIFLNDYVFTVQAVHDATTIQMDQAWGLAAISANSYQIYLGFAQVGPYARRIRFAYDPLRGAPLDVDRTQDYANRFDPQRNNTGDPEALLMMAPHASQVAQWEVYPRQSSARSLNIVYDDGWPVLRWPSDQGPPILTPEVIIAGAQADALMTKVIPRDGRTDPFYDLDAARECELQFKEYLDDAIQEDQGRYASMLQNWIEQAQGSMVASTEMARANPMFTSEDVFGR